jgi:hypothetical protein
MPEGYVLLYKQRYVCRHLYSAPTLRHLLFFFFAMWVKVSRPKH